MTNQVATKDTGQDVAGAPQTNSMTPMDMVQLAVDRGADMDQLTKLMDLAERWEANQARKEFVSALNAFKANPPQITKNKKVSFGYGQKATEYDHATLDHICQQVTPALAKHGLSHRWDVDQSDPQNGIRVRCILTHERGHYESVSMQAPPDESGGKNRIQQIASTVSYLERYTLLAATGLAAADQDDDAQKADPGQLPIRSDQKQELVDLIKETGADTRKFCQYLGVECLDDIPVSKFDRAKQALEKKRS